MLVCLLTALKLCSVQQVEMFKIKKCWPQIVIVGNAIFH